MTAEVAMLAIFVIGAILVWGFTTVMHSARDHCFGSMILFWMNVFYGNKLDTVSPVRLAPNIKMPMMLIHGEKDRRFPLEFAVTLKDRFGSDQALLFVAKGARHSESSRTSGYQTAVRSFLERQLSSSV